MFKENKTINTFTYDINVDLHYKFKVDIVVSEMCIDVWFYSSNCGIKEYLFGFLKKDCSIDKALECVKNNYKEFAENYIDEYMEV